MNRTTADVTEFEPFAYGDGTWVHWTQPHVWAEITRYAQPISRSPIAERAYWHTGGRVHTGSPDELFALLDPGMTAALADSREYFDRPYEPFLRTDLAELTAGEVHWLTEGVSGIWRVLPGQLPDEVPYDFVDAETIHVLEGAVHITTDDGETVTLRAGDIAAYPKGVTSTWRFEMPFRKLFVHA